MVNYLTGTLHRTVACNGTDMPHRAQYEKCSVGRHCLRWCVAARTVTQDSHGLWCFLRVQEEVPKPPQEEEYMLAQLNEMRRQLQAQQLAAAQKKARPSPSAFAVSFELHPIAAHFLLLIFLFLFVGLSTHGLV